MHTSSAMRFARYSILTGAFKHRIGWAAPSRPCDLVLGESFFLQFTSSHIGHAELLATHRSVEVIGKGSVDRRGTRPRHRLFRERRLRSCRACPRQPQLVGETLRQGLVETSSGGDPDAQPSVPPRTIVVISGHPAHDAIRGRRPSAWIGRDWRGDPVRRE